MRKLYVFFFCFLLYTAISAQPVISYQPVITGLTAPVEVVDANDGTNRLFVVEQEGAIRVYDPSNGGLLATPFLNISGLVKYQDEQGLLSLAFHPGYETNGYFFVYYNNTAGAVTIARYKVSANANVADTDSAKVLFTIDKPFPNHNGGHLQFGKDGHLYFATGDGGSANDPNNNAQNGLSLLGKMLRINVDDFATAPYYTVPATNPFVRDPAFDGRIWALGLRNPFRWSFDRQTGDMWIGDVGQSAKEEIDFRPASSTGGENYGWRCYEGFIRTPGVADCNPANYVPPVFDYDNPPGNAGSSVIGGYVYRGNEYPFFNGYHIAADVFSGTVYLTKPNGTGGWTTTQQAGLQNSVVAFGEAENGTLYAVSQGTSTVYKVTAASASPLPVKLQSFTGAKTAAGNELRWVTSSETQGTKFIVAYGQDGFHFAAVGEVPGTNGSGASYSFVHRVADAVPLFYRLQIKEATGESRYSSIVKLEEKEARLQVYPSVVRNGRFYINSDAAVEKVQVLNSLGALVLEKQNLSAALPLPVDLPSVPKGLYVVKVYGKQVSSAKILVD